MTFNILSNIYLSNKRSNHNHLTMLNDLLENYKKTKKNTNTNDLFGETKSTKLVHDGSILNQPDFETINLNDYNNSKPNSNEKKVYAGVLSENTEENVFYQNSLQK